jgi:hypothetical protein
MISLSFLILSRSRFSTSNRVFPSGFVPFEQMTALARPAIESCGCCARHRHEIVQSLAHIERQRVSSGLYRARRPARLEEFKPAHHSIGRDPARRCAGAIACPEAAQFRCKKAAALRN